jgi:hypothetical protein
MKFALAIAVGVIGVTFYPAQGAIGHVSAQHLSPDVHLAAAVLPQQRPEADGLCKDLVPGPLDNLCPGGKKSVKDPKDEHITPPPITPEPSAPLPTDLPRPSEQKPPSTISSPILKVVSWVSWFSYALVVASIIWLGASMAITYRTGEGGGHLRVAGLLFLCCVVLSAAPSIVRAAL